MTPWPSARVVAGIATGLVLLVFGLLKLYVAPATVGDEGIYLYLSSRVAEGALPYQDFFHAHPPLHLPLLTLIFSLSGGYTPWAGTLLPAAAAALTGILLYRAGSRLGPFEGLIACSVYLFSFDVLRMSSHVVGGNLAALWLAAGLERLARGRDVQAGVAVGLGTLTLLSVLPAAPGLFLALLLADRTRAWRFAAGLGTTLLAINLICLAVFGRPFLEQVYLYHFGKPAVSVVGASLYALVYYNTWLVAGGACGAILVAADALRQRGPGRTVLLRAALGGALGALVFLLSLERFFVYYTGALFVCLALLAGAGIWKVAKLIGRALIERDARAALAASGLALPLMLAHVNHVVDGAAPSAALQSHAWVGSGLAQLDAPVRLLLWRDESLEGGRYLGWTHYLWHETDSFEALDPLTREIRRRTQPGDMIFGDSTAAPLVALHSGRRLVADAADTNVARMAHGAPALEQLLEVFESRPPALVLIRERRGIHSVRRFREWLEDRYVAVYRFSNPTKARTFVVYAPVDATRGGAAPPSRRPAPQSPSDRGK